MAGLTSRADCWTVAEASGQFAKTGVPLSPGGLAAIIKVLREESGGRWWTPVAETRPVPGGKGGRGYALYEIGEFQLLHTALARWLIRPG